MGLTYRQKERIDMLDFSKGGGFSDFITTGPKLQPNNNKYLFIGLGGKGSEVVADIKDEVYRKMVCNPETKRPDNFEYLALDTDRNCLEDLKRGSVNKVGLSEKSTDMETCWIYSEMASQRLMRGCSENIMPSNVSEWLNPNMNQYLAGDGAGGTRQAARYLLFSEDTFRVVLKSLELKLKRLYNQMTYPRVEPLVIYIFAGLGGGTGSALAIDIAYIVRELCERNNWNIRLNSYLFLHDTYTFDREYIRVNTYAALKEIDTLMNLSHLGGATCFKARYATDFYVESAEKIFDSCVLVAGSTDYGLVPNNVKFTKKTVVDDVMARVTRNDESAGFLRDSFEDNSLSAISNAVSFLEKRVPRDSYYNYSVMGVSGVVLPLEQLITYLAHGTMGKLQEAWNKHPVWKDVEIVLNDLHIMPQEIAGYIVEFSRVPMMKYVKGIVGPIAVPATNQAPYNNVELYSAWVEVKNLYLSGVIEKLSKIYYEILSDGNRGIYYLKELMDSKISERHSTIGLIGRLEEYKHEIRGFVLAQEDKIYHINQDMQGINEKLNHPVRGLFSGKLTEVYKELCVLRIAAENTIYLYDILVRECLDQIIDFAKKKLFDLQNHIDTLTYMGNVVENNYKYLLDGNTPYSQNIVNLFAIHSFDKTTDNIILYLDEMLKSKSSGDLAESLARDIVAEEKKWEQSEEAFNPMQVFVSFLENQYPEISNLTLEDFFRLKYGVEGLHVGIENICREMNEKLELLFPLNRVIYKSSFASYHRVIAPNTTQSIKEQMDRFGMVYGARLVYGADRNSMYWYNHTIGVPLFMLESIYGLEDAYERNTNPGMHCWESEVDNWKEWPALTNRAWWPTDDFNRREKKYMGKVQEDTKKYLDNGLIYPIPYGKYVYYEAICLPEDIDCTEILEWCRSEYILTVRRDDKGQFEVRKKLLETMKATFGIIKCKVNIPTIYMDVTEDNLYQVLRKNVGLYKKLQEMYTVYQECVALLEQKLLNEVDDSDDK